MKAALRMGVAIYVAVLLGGCSAPRQQPWLAENGTVRGTVVTTVHPDGSSTKRYFDLVQHLVRFERFDAQGAPIAGAWLSTFTYESGRRVMREEWATDGSRATNTSGYSIARLDPETQSCRFFSVDEEAVNRTDGAHRVVQSFVDGRLTEVAFYDVSGAPVPAPRAARRVYVYRGADLTEIRHLDAIGKPAAAVYRDIEVSIVRYEVLHGVDDRTVIAEHYLDTSGRSITSEFYPSFPTVPDDCGW